MRSDPERVNPSAIIHALTNTYVSLMLQNVILEQLSQVLFNLVLHWFHSKRSHIRIELQLVKSSAASQQYDH